MTPEQYKECLCGLLSDDITKADISEIVNQLNQAYETTLAEKTAAEERAADMEAQATKYAKVNNDLYLQLGVQKKHVEPEETVQEPPKKLRFEDLDFD